MNKLDSIWCEDSPVIYEMVCAIQDDIVPTLLAEYPDVLVQDANGDITIEFDTVGELEGAYEDA